MLKVDLSVLSSLDLSMYDTVDFVINTGSSSFSIELPNILGRLMSSKFNSLFESDQNTIKFNFSLDNNVLRRHQRSDNTNQSEEEYLRRIFEKMIEAYKGAEVEVTLGECEVIREISESIGSKVELRPPEVEIREENFRDMLNAYGTEESIEYAAENLERLREDDVNGISPEMLEKVLKSEKLKVRSENSLFEIVSRFVESNGGECIGLLSLIEIMFLGVRERIEYIKIIRRWAKRNFVGRDLLKVLDSFESFVKEISTNGYSYSEDITSGTGIDVDITALSEYFPYDPKRNLEGFKKQNNYFEFFVTNNLEDSWIQWDFHNDVFIQSYEIECDRFINNFLRNWKIEVSDNGSDWDPVDERQNQTQLTKGTKTKYSIKTPKFARYLRLKQIGKNSSGDYFLAIRNVKFGGIYKRL